MRVITITTTPIHVLCFFFMASKHVSTDFWNLQCPFSIIFFVYPESGFYIQIISRRIHRLFCAQNRSSMFITASLKMQISGIHGWFLLWLVLLRWPKVQRSDPCLLLSRLNNTPKRLCFFSFLATQAKGVLSPSSWHRLLWLSGRWRIKLYQDSRHVEILHFFSI